MYNHQILMILTITTLLLVAFVHGSPTRPSPPPIQFKDGSTTIATNKGIDTEVSDLNAVNRLQDKSQISTQEMKEDTSSVASSSVHESSYAHRDEDQLNSATNLVLAQNLKYDVEILESSNTDNANNKQQQQQPRIELEEQFRGDDGLKMTDIFDEQNIEVAPIDVNSQSIAQSHMLLSIVLVVLALISVALYAGLVIWRSHLERRYGMRELLVSHDDEVEVQQHQQQQQQPPHPYPSNPTTRSNNHYTLVVRT